MLVILFRSNSLTCLCVWHGSESTNFSRFNLITPAILYCFVLALCLRRNNKSLKIVFCTCELTQVQYRSVSRSHENAFTVLYFRNQWRTLLMATCFENTSHLSSLQFGYVGFTEDIHRLARHQILDLPHIVNV